MLGRWRTTGQHPLAHSLTVYLSDYLTVCLTVCLSICLTVWLNKSKVKRSEIWFTIISVKALLIKTEGFIMGKSNILIKLFELIKMFYFPIMNTTVLISRAFTVIMVNHISDLSTLLLFSQSVRQSVSQTDSESDRQWDSRTDRQWDSRTDRQWDRQWDYVQEGVVQLSVSGPTSVIISLWQDQTCDRKRGRLIDTEGKNRKCVSKRVKR